MTWNGTPQAYNSFQQTRLVPPGTNLSALWRHTLKYLSFFMQPGGPNDAMDSGHWERLRSYLEKSQTQQNISGIGNGWFKIRQRGYTNGKRATKLVIENKRNQAIQIPSRIENCQCLLRDEMIALYGARSTGAAQL
ncbi:hypothetical protein V8F20_011463, partial [Naviculisporaceae sp. PSN 640]